jgi:uncharacterized protein (DUF169 family)
MEPADLEKRMNDKEVIMSSNPRDYSVFDKFNFERKPVGVKFVITRPEGIERLDKELNFCEMLKEAQTSSPFYVGEGDFHCVETMVLGMEDPEPVLVSGLLGGSSGLFKEARANRKLYQYLPKMLKGSVKYVAFSPIDQLTFDPDVMVITATVSQAQTILRSVGYSTGDYFSSKATPVVSCAWMYVYPVLSGEMNFTVTGGYAGTKRFSTRLVSYFCTLEPTAHHDGESGGDVSSSSSTTSDCRRTQEAIQANTRRFEKDDRGMILEVYWGF